MKVSIIATVYKNVVALKFILDSLLNQTYKDFEVVIAEDDQSAEIKALLQEYEDLDILHVSQPDNGMQKNIIQNKALAQANGEYLIFIDGDCIPYTTFIENHLFLSSKGCILSGRRVNLNSDVSDKLRDASLTPLSLEKNYLIYFELMRDKSVKYEQGIYLSPRGFIYKNFIENSKRNASILGCNFSCFRDDFIAINGFDESYAGTAIGDDTDLDWRFRAYGLKLKSCKNAANLFHLHHKVYDRGDASDKLAIMREREENNQFICEDGVKKYLK